jgi:isohexenylglutaconyl-CoA hydratase
VILRGKGGHFCAGGDIKDMAALRVEAANVGSYNLMLILTVVLVP